ncbi:MAG: hypothetical protein GX638_02585 [Crenarchaeota archaeon]|nr:hypothetical protein [Thermoproteota archaeon]
MNIFREKEELNRKRGKIEDKIINLRNAHSREEVFSPELKDLEKKLNVVEKKLVEEEKRFARQMDSELQKGD